MIEMLLPLALFLVSHSTNQSPRVRQAAVQLDETHRRSSGAAYCRGSSGGITGGGWLKDSHHGCELVSIIVFFIAIIGVVILRVLW